MILRRTLSDITPPRTSLPYRPMAMLQPPLSPLDSLALAAAHARSRADAATQHFPYPLLLASPDSLGHRRLPTPPASKASDDNHHGLPGRLDRSALRFPVPERDRPIRRDIGYRLDHAQDGPTSAPWLPPSPSAVEALPSIHSFKTPRCSFESSFSTISSVESVLPSQTSNFKIPLGFTPPRTASPTDTVVQQLTVQDLTSTHEARRPRHIYDDDEQWALVYLSCSGLTWDVVLWHMQTIFSPGASRRADTSSDRTLPATYEERDMDGYTSKLYRLRTQFGMVPASELRRNTRRQGDVPTSLRKRKLEDEECARGILEKWIRTEGISISPDVILQCESGVSRYRAGCRDWIGTREWDAIQAKKEAKERKKGSTAFRSGDRVRRTPRRRPSPKKLRPE